MTKGIEEVAAAVEYPKPAPENDEAQWPTDASKSFDGGWQAGWADAVQALTEMGLCDAAEQLIEYREKALGRA
jgi:hypothetical protein